MPRKTILLSVEDHARDSAGMTYVYPVVSRRAGGVSIGINLNPNNACNWQCVYCQVPDLKRGGPPPIDLKQLRRELTLFLDELLSGRFMQDRVPVDARTLQDVAFSGNGEPTLAAEFAESIKLVVDVLRKHSLLGKIKLRLITNGSQLSKPDVQQGLAIMSTHNGEVWFKLDGATNHQFADINGVRVTTKAHLNRLRECAALCPTWIQSCFFGCNGRAPSAAEVDAYVDAIGPLADVVIGVNLYGIARRSMQPQADRLGRLPATWFATLAKRLRRCGLKVAVSP